MQNLEPDASLDGRVIPARIRATGLERCFLYRGNSMIPTFRPGQLLYVRPGIRDLKPGDVIVFPRVGEAHYIVHRVTGITAQGLITRGDNNAANDVWPTNPHYVVGRVEMLEERGVFESVRGGRRGLFFAQIGRLQRRGLRPLYRFLRFPYRALRRAQLLRRLFGWLVMRQIKTISLKTPDGPLIKMIHRGRTIACWWPEQRRFECRRPYDLFIPNPDTSKNTLV